MTARELLALIESHVSEMPPDEQRRFWVWVTEHPSNVHYKEVLAVALRNVKTLGEGFKLTFTTLADGADQLTKKLKKHRRPAKNAERDAEILKHHRLGKNAGEIAIRLRDRWPGTTAGAIRNVIRQSRNRPDPKA